MASYIIIEECSATETIMFAHVTRAMSPKKKHVPILLKHITHTHTHTHTTFLGMYYERKAL